MQECNRCHMQIRGYKHSCPLCGGPLTGEGADPAFPTVKRRRFTRRLAIRIAGFIMAVALIGLWTFRYIVDRPVSWLPLAVLTVIISFVNVCITAYYRSNPLKIVSWQVYFAMLLSMIIDFYTGNHGWAVSWVLPSGFLAMMIIVTACGFGMRMRMQDFVLYLMFNTILSFIQLIFVRTGYNRFPIPAVASMSLVLILFIGVLIFRWRDFSEASSRYFNI